MAKKLLLFSISVAELHLFGKEPFIRFTVHGFSESLSMFACASFTLGFEVGFDCISF